MKRVIIGCGLLFFAFGFLFAQTVNTGPSVAASPGELFEIVANGEMAVALCFGKPYKGFDEVLFKGPSGIKIRVTNSKENDLKTHTVEFSLVGGHAVYKISMSTLFYEQNLPIPTVVTINGVVICGLGDNGEREKELQTAVQKEYNKLPNDFQQGLREFYQYCAKSSIELSTISVSLLFVLGSKFEPFHVDEVIDRDPLAIQALQKEFNCN